MTSFILYFVILVTFHSITHGFPQDAGGDKPKDKHCYTECGGVNAHAEAEKEGIMKCVKGDDISHYASSPCEIECYGTQAEVAEDQNSCYCEICKTESQGYLNFCTAAWEQPLESVEQCEKTICAGEGGYKYFGIFCDAKERR